MNDSKEMDDAIKTVLDSLGNVAGSKFEHVVAAVIADLDAAEIAVPSLSWWGRELNKLDATASAVPFIVSALTRRLESHGIEGDKARAVSAVLEESDLVRRTVRVIVTKFEGWALSADRTNEIINNYFAWKLWGRESESFYPVREGTKSYYYALIDAIANYVLVGDPGNISGAFEDVIDAYGVTSN